MHHIEGGRAGEVQEHAGGSQQGAPAARHEPGEDRGTGGQDQDGDDDAEGEDDADGRGDGDLLRPGDTAEGG